MDSIFPLLGGRGEGGYFLTKSKDMACLVIGIMKVKRLGTTALPDKVLVIRLSKRNDIFSLFILRLRVD